MLNSSLELPCSEADLLKALERELERRTERRKLVDYGPYPKQKQFHDAGRSCRERLFLAGNRCGKTQAGAYEMAMHLTGRYPQWWDGKVFERPVRAWAAGVTGESTRDVVQEKLFGPPDRRDSWGTGAIPADAIGDIATGRGIANAIDMASIRHASGGWSSLAFKSYEKGREKWQGAALEVIWMDEEGPMDIYLEGLTRTNETGGIVYMTCTPLLGMSDVMTRFLQPENG
jgi:phage terminase large subunit-like protein